MVAAAGVLLSIAYAAVTSQGKSKSGYDAIVPETPVDPVAAKLALEIKQKKELEKEKGKGEEGCGRPSFGQRLERATPPAGLART